MLIPAFLALTMFVWISKPYSLELNLSGPAVESLTFILFVPFIFGFYLLKDYKFSINSKKYLYISFLIFFSLEMVYRYTLNSECFLNYSCRFEAKTVGLFSTTNVTGASIALICLSLLTFAWKWKWPVFILLNLVLLTTMARAVIVGYLIALAFISFQRIRSNTLKLVIGSFILFSIVFLFLYFNALIDGSFLSKIDFIKSTALILQNSSWMELLIGNGISFEKITRILDVQGWSPHAPYLKALLYYGFFGLLVYFVTILLILRLRMVPVLLCYAAFSFGGAPIIFPSLLSAYFLTINDEKK
tara:strand:- start:5357 stop:6262 length:906 start_codon:yes stop_codon:yes gene_type:complete